MSTFIKSGATESAKSAVETKTYDKKFCFAVGQLKGNVGKEARMVKSVNGKDLLVFNVAVNQTGDLVDWHNISVWNPELIKFCGTHLDKGVAIYMKFRLTTGQIKNKAGERLHDKTYLHPYFMSILNRADKCWYNSDGTITPTKAGKEDAVIAKREFIEETATA